MTSIETYSSGIGFTQNKRCLKTETNPLTIFTITMAIGLKMLDLKWTTQNTQLNQNIPIRLAEIQIPSSAFLFL